MQRIVDGGGAKTYMEPGRKIFETVDEPNSALLSRQAADERLKCSLNYLFVALNTPEPP